MRRTGGAETVTSRFSPVRGGPVARLSADHG